MNTLGNIFYGNYCDKNNNLYVCEKCNFNCKQNSDMIRHLATAKHKRKFAENNFTGENKNYGSAKMYSCYCSKSFKTASGLWKHQKKCDFNDDPKFAVIDDHDTDYEKTNNIINNNKSTSISLSNDELTNIVLDIVKNSNELQKQNMELQKQNIELQKQMIDVCKNIQPTVSNTINQNNINQNNINQNNSNNKTFNLQFFLNETCKDAMNISEFIENISLQLGDLETLGHLGYVEGISKIIIKNLRALDVEKRPVHCSDIKREIMYVKDKDKWEKENDEKQKIKQVISAVVSKNIGLLPQFQKKYPECMNPESKKSDEYNQIIMEAMSGGATEVGIKNKEKIVRRIAKEVVIDKE